MQKFLAILLLMLGRLALAQDPYTVNLAWTPSSTAGTTAENVYRAPYPVGAGPCGAFVKLTTTVLAPAVAAYVDAAPAPGSAYCYGVTAVGPTGESPATAAEVSNVNIPPAPPTGLNVTVAADLTVSNVRWAWVQSPTAPLKYDEIYCRPSPKKSFTPRWKSAKPATVAVLTMDKGSHDCEVTAVGVTGASGPSNDVIAVVQ